MNCRILVPLALLFLAGCATMPGPSVSLVNVAFTQATVFETTAQFTLRINNESPEPLVVDGSSHRIYLNGLYIGDALSNEAVEVPRLSSVTQSVTVHLSNLAMAARIKAIIESRVFDYTINSVFYTQAGRLHSQSVGRLDLKDFTPSAR